MNTHRLLIRRFQADDWEDLYEYLSQAEVVTFEPYGVFSKEDCRREAARRAENSAFWAVCLKDTGKLIGNIYLSKGEFDTWTLGYVLNARYQGNGYATEAAFALVDHTFRKEKARRLIAMCNPLNEASWRLLERLGLRREGRLRQNIFFKRDALGRPIWADTYEYGILASEWLALHDTGESEGV